MTHHIFNGKAHVTDSSHGHHGEKNAGNADAYDCRNEFRAGHKANLGRKDQIARTEKNREHGKSDNEGVDQNFFVFHKALFLSYLS